jgi:hypothetical protein
VKLVELLTLPPLVAQLIQELGKLVKRRRLADLLSGRTARQLAETTANARRLSPELQLR